MTGAMVDYRISIFDTLPIKHKNIICQPLIERIDIEKYLSGVELVVVGGDADNNARPLDYEWVQFGGRENMIRNMKESDWNRVAQIYKEELERGKSTFNTVCPEYEEWDKNHLKDCRYVAETDDMVVGWAAISATSAREPYKGVVEVSIYIDEKYQGQGIGTRLLKTLCTDSEKMGYWCLYSAIFSINEASIALHKKCGFREIGYRERIAKDKFGNWQNTTLMERRIQE